MAVGVAGARTSTWAPPLSCSARPHAPPSANGCEGSLGKFPFRFLLPPSVPAAPRGRLPGSPLPGAAAAPPSPPPQVPTRCRPSNVWWWEMGRYLVTLLTAPTGEPETLLHRCPQEAPYLWESPEAARRTGSFSPEPQGAPGVG